MQGGDGQGLSKFISTKQATAAGTLAIIAAIPTVDPVTTGIKIAALAAVAIGYMISNALQKAAEVKAAGGGTAPPADAVGEFQVHGFREDAEADE